MIKKTEIISNILSEFEVWTENKSFLVKMETLLMIKKNNEWTHCFYKIVGELSRG